MNDYKPTPAHIHRERGRCCKSLCLHCPYGYTLQHLNFVYKKVDAENLSEAQGIIDTIQPSGVAAMLLGEGFGGPAKKTIITNEAKEHYRLFYLKDFLCGLVRVDKNNEELFLLKDFNDQGIELELVLDQFQKN